MVAVLLPAWCAVTVTITGFCHIEMLCRVPRLTLHAELQGDRIHAAHATPEGGRGAEQVLDVDVPFRDGRAHVPLSGPTKKWQAYLTQERAWWGYEWRCGHGCARSCGMTATSPTGCGMSTF